MEPGSSIANYTITRELGRGGMGVVYLARDESLDRDVAIKSISTHSEDHLARFQRESRILASLNHPSIASVIALETVDNTPHLVMEYAPGESLDAILNRAPFHIDDALNICAQIASAVAAAHNAGVIHRDLKPANVVVSQDCQAKVLDFGLARHVEQASTSSDSFPTISLPTSPLTREGATLGTPGYMSPEQARGRKLDRSTDVFSFGCILYECLTAKRAFTGDTATDAIAALIEREPDWSALPPNTPTRVRLTLERCLQKNPAKRLRDLTDAQLELETALNTAEWSTTQLDSHTPTTTTKGSRLLLPALILFTFLIAATIVAPAFLTPKHLPPEPTHFTLSLPQEARLARGRDMNEVAISPDGRTIAYLVEPHEGNLLLYVQSLNEFKSRHIPIEGDPRGPSFSPDARWIYYMRDYSYVERVPTAGGAPERIATLPSVNAEPSGSFEWLDDSTIVYAHSSNAIVTIETTTGKYITHYDLKTHPSNLRGFAAIEVIPHSNALLLAAWDGHRRSDHVIGHLDLDTKKYTPLLERASAPTVIGQHIVYLRDSALYAVGFDPDTPAITSEPRLVLQGVNTGLWGAMYSGAISSTGTFVFSPGQRAAEGRRIASIDRNGTVEYPIDSTEPFMTFAVLSPDASRIATVVLDDEPEIKVFDLQTGATQRIVPGAEVYNLVFSPDSTSIYFVAWESQTSEQLMHWNLADDSVQEIHDGNPQLGVQQALDDNTLLVGTGDWSDRSTLDIQTFNIAEKTFTPLYASQSADWPHAISPDNRWLLFNSNISGQWRTYIRAYPEGDRNWLVIDRDTDNMNWSADGSRLYYTNEEPIESLCEIDFTLDEESNPIFSEPRKIHTSISFNKAEDIDVTPDDKVLFIDIAEWEKRDPQLRVITNFDRVIRRAFEPEN